MTQTHPLAEQRDAIDALIGPIEEIMAKVESMPDNYVRAYVLGGLEQAKDTLESARNEIDEFEPEEESDEIDPAEAVADMPDEDDEDEDEDR